MRTLHLKTGETTNSENACAYINKPHKSDSGQRGINTVRHSLSLSQNLHNLLYIGYITMNCTKYRTRFLARLRNVTS